MVFSTQGGGAHATACRALESYLGDRYELRIFNFFERFVRPLDPFWAISFGRFSGEDFYNLCLRRGWHRTANHLATTYAWPRFLRLAPKIAANLVPFLEEERPDLVISVIPLVNAILASTLRERGIPLVVLPVDLDTTNYIVGLAETPYDKLRFVLPFDDLEIRRRIAPARLPREHVRVIAFPLRPGFLGDVDRAQVRADFGLPDDRPVVMLLGGGAGSSTLRRFAKALGTLDVPAHLAVCVGRNEKLGRRVARLPNGQVTRTVVGYTDRIADLMAVSDLLISKPGPATVSEAIYMNLPMLLDATTRVLCWEELNLDLVRQNGLGDVFTSRRDLAPWVGRFLAEPELRRRFRTNLAAFPKYPFPGAFTELVAEALSLR